MLHSSGIVTVANLISKPAAQIKIPPERIEWGEWYKIAKPV